MNKRTILYEIPVSLLYHFARELQPPERVAFGTGVALTPDHVVLCHQLPVRFEASRVHAQPNDADLIAQCEWLQVIGQEIEVQAHSHPGRGANAIHPSEIDLQTARRWEASGRFLGVIFCEGGEYVRFFSYSQQSVVRIHGMVEATDEPDCYRLPAIVDDPVPTESTEDERGAERSPGALFVVEAEPNQRKQRPARRWRRFGL